jgi:uncharacterized RDD family membrane protein YckC
MIEQHSIETPENISFGYPIAGIGSRFLAVLVDTLIQSSLFMFTLVAVLLVVALLEAFPERVPEAVGRWLPEIGAVIMLVTLFIIQFGYFIILEIASRGSSPGKQLVGLRVIKENGYPLKPLDSIIRNLVRIVDFFPFGYGVGMLAMFLNARAKRLGDFAAGTIVVRVDQAVKLADLATPPAAAVDLPGVERLTEADIELVESYLQRRKGFRNADILGAAIAARVRTLMGQVPGATGADASGGESPADFLGQVAAAYRSIQSRR